MLYMHQYQLGNVVTSGDSIILSKVVPIELTEIWEMRLELRWGHFTPVAGSFQHSRSEGAQS